MINRPLKHAVRRLLGFILVSVTVSLLLLSLYILHRALHLSQIVERDQKKTSLFLFLAMDGNELGMLKQTKLKC